MANNKKIFKIIGKSVLIVFLAVLVAVCGYVTYFVSAFDRIDDNLSIQPSLSDEEGALNTSTYYDILSWNVGFGAYSDDYSFFMDGGKYSRAFSEEAVNKNLLGIQNAVAQASKNQTLDSGFDFICYQEVDYDSTRSYHVDLREKLISSHVGYSYTYAQNYNSPYILYPFNSPHGANKSGLLTLSKYQIKTAIRKQLPIESGFTKYFDLDRCYSKNRIDVNNGKELVLINLHLSAYTSDGTIAIEQLELLLADCKAEVENGNYVICAGDFNKDLVDEEGGSAKLFGQDEEAEGWAKQIDPAIFTDTGMEKIAPIDVNGNPVPTCRNANKPYAEGNKVYVIDGFLVSSNVLVFNSLTIDEQFKYSDHNPVVMKFRLG